MATCPVRVMAAGLHAARGATGISHIGIQAVQSRLHGPDAPQNLVAAQTTTPRGGSWHLDFPRGPHRCQSCQALRR